MEVHAHSHTARKKWTHYLWEFIMLFLAVFCGFLAENKREHIVEHHREKVYVQSLFEDLKEDTARLQRIVERNLDKFNNTDSFITLMDKTQLSADEETRIYNLYFTAVTGIFVFRCSDRTYRQLINSGNMRLIREPEVNKKILDYYGPQRERVDANRDDMIHFIYDANEFSEDIFDLRSVRITLNSDSTFNQELADNRMKLLTHDANIIRKYLNKVAVSRAIAATYTEQVMEMKRRALALMASLQKEYRLR